MRPWALMLALTLTGASAADPVDRLLRAARADGLAWERLAELCDRFPHRLSGSEGLEGAVEFTRSLFEEDGFEPWLQEVMVPHWERGEERLEMVAPASREMRVLALGGTVGVDGLEAEAAVVSSVDELGPWVEGKIVVYDSPMPEDGIAGYGAAVGLRYSGAVEAARHGAVAALLRSVTTRSLDTPHTGGTGWNDDGLERIPYAAITPEDAQAMSRLAAAEVPITLRLTLGATTHPDALSHNVIAEIEGTEFPDEVVVVSGHLDAWDVGCGAQDDAVGVIQSIETLRLMDRLGLRPRRTVRAVLWTNEENGSRGGREYAATLGARGHVAAIESDLGAGGVVAWSAEGTDGQLAWLEPMVTRLGLPLVQQGSGVDIAHMREHDVLLIGLRPDDTRYFDLHHSPADTLDKVVPAHFLEGLAQMAGLAWQLANEDLPD